MRRTPTEITIRPPSFPQAAPCTGRPAGTPAPDRCPMRGDPGRRSWAVSPVLSLHSLLPLPSKSFCPMKKPLFCFLCLSISTVSLESAACLHSSLSDSLSISLLLCFLISLRVSVSVSRALTVSLCHLHSDPPPHARACQATTHNTAGLWVPETL